jgi:hypothetical protein
LKFQILTWDRYASFINKRNWEAHQILLKYIRIYNSVQIVEYVIHKHTHVITRGAGTAYSSNFKHLRSPHSSCRFVLLDLVDHCLSFCPFSFGHCVVCCSSNYGFWLPLWYLQTLLSTNKPQKSILYQKSMRKIRQKIKQI